MASVIGKYAAKRLMNSTFKKYAKEGYGGQYDPLFHEVDDPRHAGRKKKVKKQIPAYIPEDDAIVLAKVRKMAYRMDMSLFHFLGTRLDGAISSDWCRRPVMFWMHSFPSGSSKSVARFRMACQPRLCS